MSSSSLLRLAVRSTSSSIPFFRSSYGFRRFPIVSSATGSAAVGGCSAFSTNVRRLSDQDGHHEESFEEFTARYAVLVCWGAFNGAACMS